MTSLNDLIKADGLLGEGEIALLDERGRVVTRERFQNFIGLYAKEYFQEIIACILHGYNATLAIATHSQYAYLANNLTSVSSGSTLCRVPAQHPFGTLYLSDSTNAESSGTERLVPGKVLGVGLKNTRAAQGNVIGIVAANSSAGRLSSTYRWEWASGQANGTIGSVGWCPTTEVEGSAYGQTTWMGLYAPLPWECLLPRNVRTAAASTAFAIRHTDGLVYYSDGTTSLKSKAFLGANPPSRTNTVTDSTSPFTSPTTVGTIPASTTIADLAWDNTNSRLWISNGTSPYNIVSIDPGTPGTAVNNFTTSGSPTIGQFIACDGTNVYYVTPVSSGTSSATIYKVPIATGTSTTFATHSLNASPTALTTPTNSWIQGMYWDYTSGKLVIVELTGSNVSMSTGSGYNRYWATIYNSNGTIYGYTSLENGFSPTNQPPGNPVSGMTGTSYCHGFAEYNGYVYANIGLTPTGSPVQIFNVYRGSNLASRSLLGTPIVKTSSNSLRLDYTISVA